MRGLLKRFSAVTLAALIALNTPLCSMAYEQDLSEILESEEAYSYDFDYDFDYDYDYYDEDAIDESFPDDFDMDIADEEISDGYDEEAEEPSSEEDEYPASEEDEYPESDEADVPAPDEGDAAIELTEEPEEKTESAEEELTVEEIPSLKSGYDKLQLVVGQSADLGEYLKAEVIAAGFDPEQKGAKYVLEESSVLSITAKGVIKAKAKGQCYIRWATPNKHGKLTNQANLLDVNVTKASLQEKTKILTYVGQTYDYTYAVSYNYENPPVSFESSNPKVCTVDEKGIVTAVSKGTAKVSAIWGGGEYNVSKYKLTGTVKVNVPALSKTEATILSGAKLKLKIKNVPKDAYIEWDTVKSYDVVTIESKGTNCTVTAVNPGTEVVYAEIDDHKYECAITVPGVTPKKESINLDIKKSATVSLKNTKYKATDFKWSSSASSVAKVSNKGKITAVGRGFATIYAEKNGIECAVLVTVNKSKKNAKDVPLDSAKGIAKVPVAADATEDTVIGDISDGCQLTVEAGSFEVDTNIGATPIDAKTLKKMGAYREGVFEEIISPVTIDCDGYTEGDFFGTNVTLTVPMGKPGEVIEDPSAYVFAYYDKTTKTLRYLYPDSYDLEKNEMTINLPHFSEWMGGKLKKEEQIEAFLNSYSMKRAIEEGRYDKAASELEPYIRAKAQALNLREEALKDLVQASLNAVASKVGGKIGKAGYERTGAVINSVSKAMNGVARSVADKDDAAAIAGLEDMATQAVQEAWDSLKFSERAGEVFDAKIAEGISGQAVTGLVGAYKMYKYIDQGDTTSAMKELGNIMMNVHPAVELGTKGTAFVASCINVEFTYWKANEVEELYQIYKNGYDGWFGNYVIAGDRESFLEYLNYSSGFTKAKGINRFYQMDKRNEIWQDLKQRNSAWSDYKTYDELPASEKSKVQAYLEDGLMDYFELRRQQESEAAKIKAQEQLVVQTMMNSYYGALALTDEGTMMFFGEESKKDYNLTKRLEHLVQVRAYISRFINEDELKKTSKSEEGRNYGDMMNEWVARAAKNRAWESEENLQQTIDDFIEYLQSVDLLKPGLNTKYSGFNKGSFAGGFSAEHNWTIKTWIIALFADHIWDEDGNEDIEAEKEESDVDTFLDIGEGGIIEKNIRAIENMKLSEDGSFNYDGDGVSISGVLNTATRTGSGVFLLKSSYSGGSGYSVSEVDEFIHKQENPNGRLFQTPLSYDADVTYRGSFEIVPTKSGSLKFKMKGAATMNYSGYAVKEIKDYCLRFDYSKAKCIAEYFSGSKTWDNYETSMYWYLVPKKKNNSGSEG